jgi:hypothetical protein
MQCRVDRSYPQKQSSSYPPLWDIQILYIHEIIGESNILAHVCVQADRTAWG